VTSLRGSVIAYAHAVDWTEDCSTPQGRVALVLVGTFD
jgi:hypothetical protein